MSWQATSWAQNQKTGSPSGKAVLLVLANYANEYGVCWPAQNTLALSTEQSPNSVQRRLKELEKRNLIKKRKRKRNDGRWPITEYELQMTEQKTDRAADCGWESENQQLTLTAKPSKRTAGPTFAGPHGCAAGTFIKSNIRIFVRRPQFAAILPLLAWQMRLRSS